MTPPACLPSHSELHSQKIYDFDSLPDMIIEILRGIQQSE